MFIAGIHAFSLNPYFLPEFMHYTELTNAQAIVSYQIISYHMSAAKLSSSAFLRRSIKTYPDIRTVISRTIDIR